MRIDGPSLIDVENKYNQKHNDAYDKSVKERTDSLKFRDRKLVRFILSPFTKKDSGEK